MGYDVQFFLTWEWEGSFLRNDPFHPSCEHVTVEGATFCHVCGQEIRSVTINEIVCNWIEGDPSGRGWLLSHDGKCINPGGWRDHEKELRELSSRYTGTLFVLTMVGEDHPDFKRKFFLNGKMQTTKGKVVFEDFDQSKLE